MNLLQSTAHNSAGGAPHSHVFLGKGHEHNERRTWFVIILCFGMMLIEIIGGIAFGSIALVADGLHMSTHAGALLLAALAYTFSRRYAFDGRFSFGTGKLGDLAGFTSAIVLAMIALLIGYESVTRLLRPVPIHFSEAIPIAVLGLCVNIASAWLLSAGGHDHGHGHEHAHDDHDVEIETQPIKLGERPALFSIHEDGVPPRFRLASEDAAALAADGVTIETVRDDGTLQSFDMVARGAFLESRDEVPEPHAFSVRIRAGDQLAELVFEEHDHEHGNHHRDNNMRAAVIHVIADAAVSVLVIVGLVLARFFGWLWMDPIAGLIGACVIASWSYGLVRDTGAILLDMLPDARIADRIRCAIEDRDDQVVDLHLWRLGPGHLGAIVSVVSRSDRDTLYYRQLLSHVPSLSHLTVEVNRAPA
jgi:cation diffusion facilitator family transporter